MRNILLIFFYFFFFFFNDTATPEIYTLSLHDALPISPPLSRNWLHLPVGYHGRAGSVVVSGTPVTRPCGQLRPDGTGQDVPGFGPTQRLDFEAEVGFVVGVGSTLGQRVTAGEFAEHAFGFMLVNDWSARDIQVWES